MTADYWTHFDQTVWPDLKQSIESLDKRALQRGNLPRKVRAIPAELRRNLASFAYRHDIDLAAFCFHYYAATAPDPEASHKGFDVRDIYKMLLANGLTMPKSLVDLETQLGITPTHADEASLPANSVVFSLRFRLAADYLSRDDLIFYPIDNPVRKDKTLGLPMVAPTAWKGALRAAYRYVHGCSDEDPALVSFFGTISGDSTYEGDGTDTASAGALYFFPTFFGRIALSVINPQDRETGIDTRGAILTETVPADSIGDFRLLYLPGRDHDPVTTLPLITKAIHAMFLVYGVGAKTAAGFGVAAKDLVVPGTISLNLPNLTAPSPFLTLTDMLTSVQDWSIACSRGKS